MAIFRLFHNYIPRKLPLTQFTNIYIFYFTGTGCVSTQARGCAQHVLKYVVILLFQKMNMFFVIESMYYITNELFIFYLSSRNNISSSCSSSFVSVYGSSLTFLCPNRISSSVNNSCAIT